MTADVMRAIPQSRVMGIDLLFDDFDRLIQSPESVHRLRRFILDLAVRGKLVLQDANDEPASELVKRIAVEKARLVKAGEIRRQKPIAQPDEAQQAFDVPSGWFPTKLGLVAVCLDYMRKPVNGTERKRRIAGKSQSQLFPYFGATQQQGWIDEYIFDEELVLLGEDGVPFLDPLRPKAYLIAGKSWVNNHAHVFRGVLISNAYLVHYLNVFDYSGRVVGATRSKLNQAIALQIPVMLPPLAEQHRIVAKVDELMALCDRLEAARAERETTRDRLATASLARLNTPDPDPATFRYDVTFALKNLTPLISRPDQIKALRQTILNLAVRGKLVPQDPNDEPASELRKRIVAEKARLAKAGKTKRAKPPLPILPDAPFNLPVGWAWSTVGEICSKTGSGSTPRGGKNAYREKGIVFLRSQNVYNDGLHLHDVAYIDGPTHAKMSGTVVRPADLLLNITGGSMGRCCRVPDDFDEANVSQHVAIIRVAIIGLQDFVHLLILSPYFQSFIFDEQTGAGRGGLPKNKMDRIPVALPPLDEQLRIVAKVDEMMSLCDRLEASLVTGNNTCRRLLAASLHEALKPDGNCEELVH